MSDTYKLVVPKKVEEKIRYLCRKFPDLEWSGVLFTRHTGNFEDSNLEIYCEDIYPMDLGSAGFTQFKMDETVAGYIADNIELFDCDINLIHSHNKMSCFFSGQDQATLREEGDERNCFVSLIVNNEGNYCAAITRKVQIKKQIITKDLGSSYQFFGDGEWTLDPASGNTAEKTIEESIIQYFMLDVEREEVSNPLDYLDARFDEIEKKKQESRKPSWPTSTVQYGGVKASDIKEDEDFFSWIHKKDKEPEKPKYKEPAIWDDKTMKELEVAPVFTPDKDQIHAMVVHMITCSLTLNAEKFDLKQWVVKHMKKVYDRIFTEVEENTGYPLFDTWLDFIIDYALQTYVIPENANCDVVELDDFNRIIAQALYDEIAVYKDVNEYIDAYLDKLEQYIYY